MVNESVDAIVRFISATKFGDVYGIVYSWLPRGPDPIFSILGAMREKAFKELIW